MINELKTLGLSEWIYIPVIYIFWVVIFFIFKKLLINYFKMIIQKTSTPIDDIVLRAMDFPLILVILAGSGMIVQKTSLLAQDTQLTMYFASGFKAIIIIAAILFAEKFIRSLTEIYSEKVEILRTSRGIVDFFCRFIILGLGLLVLLDSFGVSVTPIIASLGIGSLAVALALQPTLENFFSGVQIIVDKSVQLGQYIKIESGDEGYVHKIGWRSTWIRMTNNNMVVVPNKTLINSKIINYYYPDSEVIVPIDVSVHYDSNLDHVEKVTLEVAREVLKDVQGGVKTFEPVVRFLSFGEYSIHLVAVLRASEYGNGALLKHEFIKRLHKRYPQEGIVIPSLAHAVNYGQEKAVKSAG